MRLVFGDNLHGEGSDDVGMQTHADGVIAEGTDRMVDENATTIHFDVLSGQRIADDGGGHGAVQLVVVAHAHDDGQHEAFQLGGDGVGGGAQGVHTGLQLLAFQFKSLEVTGGDQHGQALRQQVVAAVTGLHRHHIAKATQVFHIGTKNDFHTGSP